MPDRFPRATDSEGLLLGELAIGTRIGGYELQRKLPSRGAGHLFEATHVVLPRRAIVAVLPAVDDITRDIAHHGLRTACIIDALDHPGIPRLYECGLHGGRRPWIATQRVDGRTLASVIEARPLSALEAVGIIRDVAAVLEHAHARGLVHRDVSPATILLVEPPHRFPICITDWSGARALDARRSLPRLPSQLSAPFVAPEQREGKVLDGRADVYALGIVARRLLERVEAATTPPVFKALVHRMATEDVSARPTATEVREHAVWLAEQIEPEVAIPIVVEDDRTVPAPFERPITSEVAPNISGEFVSRRPRSEA